MCGCAYVGGGSTERNLTGVEVGETGGENVRGEDVNGAVGCKGYMLVVAADLDGAWD